MFNNDLNLFGSLSDSKSGWIYSTKLRLCKNLPRPSPFQILAKLCWSKTSYSYQIEVDNDNIEQSQITQACGYLAITVILKLWTAL